jgi:CubicO group peptidase (beta-lactamase class C family)
LTADEHTGSIEPTGFTRRDLGRILGLAGIGLHTAAAPSALATTPTGEQVGGRVWRVTGQAFPGLGGFDAAVMAFMEERSIACGSLAVTRNGRLVLARGYTWAPDRAPVAPTGPVSLFRTASVTKPVTAAAVLRLIQDGRLHPEDRVVDRLRLGAVADPRLAEVTVLHLLRHRGGWDRAVSGDPMFADQGIASALGRPLPIGQDDIVWYVTGQRLDHDPGTTFAYSNYGYLLLGRIIERVTGLPYDTYVRRAVLAPLGIGGMRLGRTLVPAPGEVPYHSQYRSTTVMDSSGVQVAAPYGSFNQENNAFNCGWLASAVDLVRLARVYDGVTPVLSAASASAAFAAPEAAPGSAPEDHLPQTAPEVAAGTAPEARTGMGVGRNGRYYGCGWHVRAAGRGLLTWHSGSLPGTYTLLVRRYDGLTWAVMFDQRDDPSGERYRDIDGELHEAADEVDVWPSGDLGTLYFGKIGGSG